MESKKDELSSEVLEGTDQDKEWARKWTRHANTTEDFQRKHFEKFGYDALLEAFQKYGAEVPVQPEPKTKPSKELK